MTIVAQQRQELSDKEKKQAICKLMLQILEILFDQNNAKLALHLGLSRSVIGKWIRAGECGYNVSQKERDNDYQKFLVLASIHRSLYSIFTNPTDRAIWFYASNSDFHGASPSDLVKSGILGAVTVKQYLDYQRGLGV